MQAASVKNLFTALPEALSEEVFEDLVRSEGLRIERILSRGQTSPAEGWYDQDENEWVVVLRGAARLLFDDGREVALGVGDCINIPSRCRHRVSWTDPGEVTIWLAVFYT